VTECARCAVLPVLGQLPISNGLAHPVLDPLGVLPSALLGMVANKVTIRAFLLTQTYVMAVTNSKPTLCDSSSQERDHPLISS